MEAEQSRRNVRHVDIVSLRRVCIHCHIYGSARPTGRVYRVRKQGVGVRSVGSGGLLAGFEDVDEGVVSMAFVGWRGQTLEMVGKLDRRIAVERVCVW